MNVKRGRVLFVLIVGVLLLLSACRQVEEPVQSAVAVQEYVSEESNSEENIADDVAAEEESASEEVTIEMISSGFSPSDVTVKAGGTVIFVNKDTNGHWPASAVHPTHTVYPGSSKDKCGTVEQDKTFDACSEVAPSDSYSFTFTEVGSWKYHDHLNPSNSGMITVVG